jgi:serine/threonine-protein kinase
MRTSAAGKLRTGTYLGPFRLEEILGEGGVGIVYRAFDTRTGTTVALKVLKRELHADVYRRRFEHEARAAAEVEHPHLVRILDVGEAAGRQFLAVAFVEGGSLDQEIAARRRLEIREVLAVAAHVGAGLDALHGHGLVHRDVKPSNILVGPERNYLLTDFGLAKGEAYTVLTRPGQVVGTLDYLAPELIRGEPGTPASDLYALGCVIYECVVGASPFAGRGILQVGAAHLEEPPPDPTSARPELSDEFAWALLCALAKDPRQRPTSAVAYATMLQFAARSAASRR